MNLREDTRIAEAARPELAKREYATEADKLSTTQSQLRERTLAVTDRIRQLPEGDLQFAPEIQLLTIVATIMEETSGILARPHTGAEAIGAETEIIELLLQSRRINPGGGGGGGGSPGGGGGGATSDSALALIGRGVNDSEVRQASEAGQAVGEVGRGLPEEFRAGLDEYFNRLDRPDG